MTDESDRMLVLLHELSTIKKEENTPESPNTGMLRKRKNEIRTEIKEVAAEKKQRKDS